MPRRYSETAVPAASTATRSGRRAQQAALAGGGEALVHRDPNLQPPRSGREAAARWLLIALTVVLGLAARVGPVSAQSPTGYTPVTAAISCNPTELSLGRATTANPISTNCTISVSTITCCLSGWSVIDDNSCHARHEKRGDDEGDLDSGKQNRSSQPSALLHRDRLVPL